MRSGSSSAGTRRSSGMQEGEVMALAGWRSREMLSRYARSAERERALASARRLSVGDRL